MTERPMRAADQAIIDMSSAIGALKEANDSAKADRKDIWKKINDTNDKIDRGVAEIKALLAPLPGLVEKVNRHDALIAGNTKSIGDAEKESNRRKWTLAGIATGLGLAGGAGLSNGGASKLSAWLSKFFGVVLVVAFFGFALAGCAETTLERESDPNYPASIALPCYDAKMLYADWTAEGFRPMADGREVMGAKFVQFVHSDGRWRNGFDNNQGEFCPLTYGDKWRMAKNGGV